LVLQPQVLAGCAVRLERLAQDARVKTGIVDGQETAVHERLWLLRKLADGWRILDAGPSAGLAALNTVALSVVYADTMATLFCTRHFFQIK
jgi:hypothetical protein